eukprot:gnl/TRDRNA2_/TRDRNA2_197734_c0_seq1.p1 gnl/TRDRNA2_/TRDRNA2_197734_c0~~gnl/TRDRNA2_/TRDRNA2_197734_c0_seq1.p1  ORF type:complete len:291 (-),score=54.66 gnl/TRDRNA2_/TRDRNA2_197734_c0_seq1:44-850(-)
MEPDEKVEDDDSSHSEVDENDKAEAEGAGKEGGAGDAPKTGNQKDRGPKSEEALLREKILADNWEQYEKLSDEELEKVIPKDPEDKLTSIGGILHSSEKCAPCSFYHSSTKGCNNGIRCKFCHMPHPKRVRQRKRTRRRGKKEKADGDDKDSEDSGKEPASKKARTARTDHDRRSPENGHNRLDERGSSIPCWLQDDSSYGRGPPVPMHAYGGVPPPHPAWGAPPPSWPGAPPPMALPAPGAYGQPPPAYGQPPPGYPEPAPGYPRPY